MASWRSTINANYGEDIEDPGEETTSFYLLCDFTLFINEQFWKLLPARQKVPSLKQ